MPKRSDKKQKRQVKEITPELLDDLDMATLKGIVLKLYEQNRQLSEQMQTFLNEKYGRKTEKHDNPDQLRIVPPSTEANQEQSSAIEPEKPEKKKKPGHSRNPMPSHLERRVIKGELGDNDKICHCGCVRININRLVRNTRYECIPVTLVVEEIVDNVFQCPKCKDTIVLKAELCEPIKNGTAGPRLLVKIAEDRWLNHLPLHRQEQMFARQGIDINRSTMCGWMASMAEALRPIYEAMKLELLKSKVIATDDTPIKVQDRTKKANIKRAHEWIFMGDDSHPVNLFHHTQGRSRAGPREFIPGFKGYILGDCFSGNRALCAELGATFVACRVHDRRYYKKARANNRALCDEMLGMYRDLFEIERTAKELNLSAQELVLMRQQESLPILERMKKWIDEHSLTALPSSSFGKALTYSLNNWDSLNVFLKDGDIRIDNNLAEQQMKLFATGRKNFYFFGSEEAGLQASVMLSLLSTCVRNNIEPGAYLYDVLTKMTENPHRDPQELMPQRWVSPLSSAEITPADAPPKMFHQRNRFGTELQQGSVR